MRSTILEWYNKTRNSTSCRVQYKWIQRLWLGWFAGKEIYRWLCVQNWRRRFSWKSKLPSVVIGSTFEAEFIAISQRVREAVERQLGNFISWTVACNTTIYTNQLQLVAPLNFSTMFHQSYSHSSHQYLNSMLLADEITIITGHHHSSARTNFEVHTHPTEIVILIKLMKRTPSHRYHTKPI